MGCICSEALHLISSHHCQRLTHSTSIKGICTAMQIKPSFASSMLNRILKKLHLSVNRCKTAKVWVQSHMHSSYRTIILCVINSQSWFTSGHAESVFVSSVHALFRSTFRFHDHAQFARTAGEAGGCVIRKLWTAAGRVDRVCLFFVTATVFKTMQSMNGSAKAWWMKTNPKEMLLCMLNI